MNYNSKQMLLKSAKFMGGLVRLNRVILRIEQILLICLMLSMLIFGFLQVFSRFVLHSPIGWSEELMTYSFTWASFMGASMAIYTESHFSVDLAMKSFSVRAVRIVRIGVWAMILVLSLFLLLMGIRLTKVNSIQMMNILPVSMLWAYLAMPICGLFIFFHSLEKMARVVTSKDGKEGDLLK